MEVIDLILLIPIVYGMAMGAWRGVLKELASLLGVILGFYFARAYSAQFSDALVANLEWQPSTATILAYILIFAVVAVGLNLLAFLLTKTLKAISLNWSNRLLGILFGGFKWLLIVSFFVNVFALVNRHLPLVDGDTIAQSKLYTPVERSLPTFVSFWKF